ncbi:MULTISPECIES: 4-hydroxyphenylpyruvate dioxygenase [Paenibacillus]|uniref:4-hydroxyphenylpyruvate dioxygenase n=1 Tax=Paenibacillus TaxID=44249 RepID=UPI0022B91ECC|nr:4-hydroxyphenylpyruvate dioxygenase [Paenibacillus caseinilyticus]MCZ8521837.1 4-hydroxyphenylpyruvate dioxygenase [Paenibacillus caseinilyticus]
MSNAKMELKAEQFVSDVFPIEDIDYVEIFVSNARQACFYYSKLFGFRIAAYKGLETGYRDACSYLLQQGEIHIVLTSAYEPEHEIAEFVHLHGDGVKDIAFRVKGIEKLYQTAIENGGIPLQPPQTVEDEHGKLKTARIGAYGEMVHTLVERTEYKGLFLPGFKEVNESVSAYDTCLTRFDHLAINVESMDEWAQYYASVFGFHLLNSFDKDDISSESSSLMTKAMQNDTERVKFPIVEPAPGKKKSQVREFLDYNRGEGVGHIALETDDIIKSVENLEKNGLKFLYTPDAYYTLLPGRVGEIEEPVDRLNQLNILVDRDEEGYLLQIFAHPMEDRPTLFFEVIQRKGSKGFGNGNIRALFEAIEREQLKRGNL